MIHDHKTLYQIPFTKEKVKELEPYFTDKVGFTVIDRSGKRHSCSLKEFMDMDYEELISLKQGFTDFMAQRKQQGLRGDK